MSRSSTALSSKSPLSQKLLAGVALTALIFAVTPANAEGLFDKLMGKADAPKAAPVAPTAPAVPTVPTVTLPSKADAHSKLDAVKADASKEATKAAVTPEAKAKAEAVKAQEEKVEAAPAVATHDSYKAGNIEISHLSAAEKNGGYEIYMKLSNGGKNDDGLSGAEVTDGGGEITQIAKTTTQEQTNKEAIEKARDVARRTPPNAALVKDAKEGTATVKAEVPKPVELPKPEYKDVTKETEGAIAVTVPAEKSTTLESGETRLILKGYKKSLKEGDVINVMLHFRSAPNATVAVKLTNKQSLIGKVFGN